MTANQSILENKNNINGIKDLHKLPKETCSVSLQALRDIIDKGPDAVIIIDQDGVVRFVNDVYSKAFGHEVNQMMGTHFKIPHSLNIPIEVDIPQPGEAPKVGEMKGVEIEWEGEKAFLITVRDITQRKKADQELRRTTEDLKKTVQELRRANQRIINQQKSVIEEERVKVLLQMAGATAHELNQPLTTLLGNIDLIKLNAGNPTELNRYMDSIEEAGKKISGIVRRIQTIPHEETQPVETNEAHFTFNKKVRILSLEDTDQDFEKISAVCKKHKKIILTRTACIQDAIHELERGKTDLILLDHVLPDGTSMDFLALLTQKGLDIPVVVITGQGDEMIASRLIQSGAYDYLPKNRINERSLAQAIYNTLEKVRLKKEIREAQKKMAEMSTKDELTGLYNRRYMNDVIRHEFSRSQRYQTDLSCLLIDLDFFKLVNDSYGHIFGDYVLKEFSVSLKKIIRESDMCFRYGGEEFMILLPNTDIVGAKLAAEKIRKMFENKVYDDGSNKTSVTLSIGITSIKHHQPKAPKDLLAFADMALYRAKADGRNRHVVYLDDTWDSIPHWQSYENKNVKHLKERLSSILEKTRKASIASIELLGQEKGGPAFQDGHQHILESLNLVGEKLGLPPSIVNTFKRAAAIHDCTKLLLGETLVSNKGVLSNEERTKIEDQPYILAELVELFEFFANERSLLLYHHENYDGSGYPEGLKASQIPLGARIFAIVDAFVAMTSERPYRERLTNEEVISELTDNAGKQFDPILVDIFLDVIHENKLLPVSGEVYTTAKQKVKDTFGMDVG